MVTLGIRWVFAWITTLQQPSASPVALAVDVDIVALQVFRHLGLKIDAGARWNALALKVLSISQMRISMRTGGLCVLCVSMIRNSSLFEITGDCDVPMRTDTNARMKSRMSPYLVLYTYKYYIMNCLFIAVVCAIVLRLWRMAPHCCGGGCCVCLCLCFCVRAWMRKSQIQSTHNTISLSDILL